MAITYSTDQVDESGKEQLVYGTPEFPIAFFYDDLTKVRVPWHWHDEFEIVVILSGTVRMSIAGRLLTLAPGEGYFANSGTLHAAELLSTSGTQHAMVFGRDLLCREEDIVSKMYVRPLLTHGNLPFVRFSQHIPWQKEALRLSETVWAAGAYESEDYPLTVRDGLCRVLALLLKHAASDSSELQFDTRTQRDEFRVKRALSYIEARCHEDLTLNDIAGSADISVSACLRCFRNVLHTTPIQYLRTYRLEQAAAALSLQDGRSVTEIASSFGFTDMSYFDRCFRKEYGLTPTAYREKQDRDRNLSSVQL